MRISIRDCEYDSILLSFWILIADPDTKPHMTMAIRYYTNGSIPGVKMGMEEPETGNFSSGGRRGQRMYKLGY